MYSALLVSVLACGIYFPDQGSNPGPLALGVRGPSHWAARGGPFFFFFKRAAYFIANLVDILLSLKLEVIRF